MSGRRHPGLQGETPGSLSRTVAREHLDQRLSAYLPHLSDVSSHKSGRSGRPKKRSSTARNRRECHDNDDGPDLRSDIPSLHKLQAAEAPKGVAKMKSTGSKKESTKTKMHTPMTAEQEGARKDKSHGIDRKDHGKNKGVGGTSERRPQKQIFNDDYDEELLVEHQNEILQMRKELIKVKLSGYPIMDAIEKELREKVTCTPKKKGFGKREAQVAINNATKDTTAKDQSYCKQREEGPSSSEVPCKKPDDFVPRRRQRNLPKI